MGEGMLSMLYIISIAFILFSTIKYNRITILPWASFWVIFFTLLAAFILTQGASSPSTLKPVFFAVCTIIAFIAPQLVNVDSKIMLRLMASFPVIGILYVSSFFADDGSIKMNVSYAFLVPIISSLVYYFTYYKEDKGKVKFLMTIVMCINVVYFVMCLLFGSRAPSLTVFLCFLFFLCTTPKNMYGFTFKKTAWLYLVLPLIIIFNFKFFLLTTESILKTFGWEAGTIERLILLDDMGMLDSGRGDINKLAFKGIADSPLWGHGMSTSEKYTGFDYPHNFILQLLLDGGILLFSIIVLPLIYRITKVKKTCSYSEFALLSALFFASVPAALFSLDLWENATFWLFMGFLFSKRYHICSNQSAV